MIDLQIQKAIILLRKNGYQVLPPKEDSSQVINEYHDKIEDLSFEHVWNLYEKKRGDKAKLKKKWEKLKTVANNTNSIITVENFEKYSEFIR